MKVKLLKWLCVIFSVGSSFLCEVSNSHKFFVKEAPKYIAGHRDVKWITKEGWGWSKTYWYYPLTIKEQLYYPIAYFKFMNTCIKDIVSGVNYA